MPRKSSSPFSVVPKGETDRFCVAESTSSNVG
uniref:Uncharacterized protein n=1 Tax=Myoviridae sp. ctLYR7 TaxID=2827679 RepID=A0A8S5RXP1_9CAUD|nr:MAG TPA: hypothetical protein [Myoviridae sp. ctLYR7]